MKIILVNPIIRDWALPNCYPQGLGYVTQALRKEHDLQILDLNVIRTLLPDSVEDIISLVDPDVDAVGITGLITSYRSVKRIIEALKYFLPKAPIIVGGPLASSIPEIILRKTKADYVVIGEGEETAIELFRTLDRIGSGKGGIELTSIEGIAYRTGTGDVVFTPKRRVIKDISSLSLPAYDLFPTETYAKNPVGSSININKWKRVPDGPPYQKSPTDGQLMVGEYPKSMNILPTRGCPWNCFFCFHDYMGERYRYRNSGSLVDEMNYLKSNYDVDFFLMASDCFVVNRKATIAFCSELLLRGNGLPKWECSARVDTVDKDLLVTMKTAGCQMICYGIESGNKQMLERLNKKFSVERAEKAVKETLEVFGQCDCTFIVGTPGETKETIQDSIDFCKRCGISPQAIFFLTPYPGTPMWEWMRRRGDFGSTRVQLDEEEHFVLQLSDNEQGQNLLVNFSDLSDEELIAEKQRFAEETGAWNR